jgi:hypothetical protein
MILVQLPKCLILIMNLVKFSDLNQDLKQKLNIVVFTS